LSAVSQAKEEAPTQSRLLRKLDEAMEWIIAGLVLLIVWWGPLAFGALPQSSFLVIQGLTVLALVLWTVRIWIQRPCRFFWAPICWAVVVFLLYALARCHWVILEYEARQELIRVLVYGAIFFLVLNNFNHRISVMGIIFCLIGLGTILSWMALLQYLTKDPTIWGFPRPEQFVERGGATFINPDHLADLLAMTIPLAVAFALMSRLKLPAKVLLGYCVLSMLIGVGVTLSRGGLLATGASLAVFGMIRLHQKGQWLPGLAVVAAVVALCVAFNVGFGALEHRFATAFNKGRLVDVRTAYWPPAVQLFEHHPLWGIGPAHFDAEFSQYRPRIVQGRPIYAHNEYLNTLAEWGAVGLAIVLSACFLLYYGAWKTWPALFLPDSDGNIPQKSDKSALVLGASIGLLAIVLHSVVDFNWHIPADAIVAVLLMALVTLHLRFVSDRYWRKPQALGKLALSLVLLGGIGWLGAQEVRGVREAYWLKRAVNPDFPPEEQLASLKRANEAEPMNYVTPYNIGEYYRLTSFEGNQGYEALGREALPWYGKSMALNPLDAFVPMRYGMTLDWLGDTNESGHYFDLAEKLDPNNRHVAYFVGRHYMDLNDYKSARGWFERSQQLRWNDLAFYSLLELDAREAETNGLYKK